MNINKYLALYGNVSRREADRLVKAGLVRINQKIAILIDKVQPDDQVFLQDHLLKDEVKKIYLALNKPIGVISTTDKNSPNNILSLISRKERLFPIGRLDVKSSGLIFLTNDGEAANFILKGKKIEKEYLVKVNHPLNQHFLSRFKEGVFIDGRKTLPAKIALVDDFNFKVTIVEGRKRQIRRISEKFGYEVKSLERIRIGKFQLEDLDLKTGQTKEISAQEFYEKIGLPANATREDDLEN